MNAAPHCPGGDSLPQSSGWRAPSIEGEPRPLIEVEGPDHRVGWVNAAFCRLLQRPRGELVGKCFAEIVSNGEYCVAKLDQVYALSASASEARPEEEAENNGVCWVEALWPDFDAEAQPRRVIIRLMRPAHFHKNAADMNEALLVSSLHQHELREATEKVNAQLVIEVAERERMAESLRETQEQLRLHAGGLEAMIAERTAQLRASVGELEAFSYSLVHDLRAPIRAIRGFTEMVLDLPRDEVGTSAVELLNRVVKAAARMDSLIQDVLSLSQVLRQPMKPEKVDVDLLVRDIVRERPELAFPLAEIVIDGPLLPMLGHEATLSQCLTNLLSNAVKFVRPGGAAKVRLWSEARRSPTAEGEPEPTVVRLWVEDRGIGIALEAQKGIFEIFQRLHTAAQYEGSGIGLAIVSKGIIRMGGRVGVESTPGEGSRFWVELPRG